MARLPRLRIDTNTPTMGLPSQNPPVYYPRKGSRHESVHRSMQLEIRVFSPAIKSTPAVGNSPGRTLPVFGDHDEVAGVVLLDPRYCTSPGRITVTLEGKFAIGHVNPHDGRRRGTQQHTFFTSSQTFYSPEPNGVQTPMTLRETLANTVRPKPWRTRANSVTQSNGHPPNFFPFRFDIPQVQRGQEMPPSFSISSVVGDSNDGTAHAEEAEVSYTITALWGASDGSDQALVEAPIVFQPEMDFDCLDGLSKKPQAWLELPLRTDRSRVPFQCAITLPNPASFSKNGQIPFFVVFTTQPRSKALCREIAADATIAVSLIRKVTVNIQRPCTIVSPPYSAPVTHQKGHGPPSAWTMGSNLEEGDSRSTAATILKRIKSTPPRLMKSSSYTDLRSAFSVNKELPALPPPSPPSAVAFTEARTLQTRMSIGFPKRPRSACAPDEHPSLEAHTALPDGLHKGRVDLNPQLLPSIDWAGLNVKYYIDVSVLFGQDELRARVPVRIF